MVGDYEWANNALGEELGEVWEADTWGQNLLHMGYYDTDLSTDLHYASQTALDTYLEMYYDVVFDEIFDWDAYQAWYDSQ